MDNITILQAFEWYLPNVGILYERLTYQAKKLKDNGIDAVWLPPATKAVGGMSDVGYGVYDLYDLGEFDQKGSISTKYGTKDEYVQAVNKLHEVGIKVITDIVLNQRLGADYVEYVNAIKCDEKNRNQQLSEPYEIGAWTGYSFPGRGDKYSDFKWNASCFTGVDRDEKAKQDGVYLLEGKKWSYEVDKENGNYDYLMGADVDMNNPAVVEELTKWGKWYYDTIGMDGFRLDAVKHIQYDFYKKWVEEMKDHAGKELLVVGEYWSGNVEDLKTYLKECGYEMNLFDVPLHFNFWNAARMGRGYGMQGILAGALSEEDSDHAITFVDNHDTQPGQSLESWVEEWFKPIAYSIILLRSEGIPCVFYADYYGLRGSGESAVFGIKRMLAARRYAAYGEQHDYFDNNLVVGWTREGDTKHSESAAAVLISTGDNSEKKMYVGKQHAGVIFRDVLRRIEDPVTIDNDGYATFKVTGGSVSVWVREQMYRKIIIEFD